MYRIFVVEDDPGIAQGIFDLVVLWGMEAVLAQDFREITKEFQEAAPQLVLMDITLPFYNGYHWCQEIRKLSRVPMSFYTRKVGLVNKKKNIRRHCRAFNCILMLCMVYSCCTFL